MTTHRISPPRCCPTYHADVAPRSRSHHRVSSSSRQILLAAMFAPTLVPSHSHSTADLVHHQRPLAADTSTSSSPPHVYRIALPLVAHVISVPPRARYTRYTRGCAASQGGSMMTHSPFASSSRYCEWSSVMMTSSSGVVLRGWRRRDESVGIVDARRLWARS